MDFIPDHQFQPDAPTADAVTQPTASVSQPEPQVATQAATPDFVPDSEFKPDAPTAQAASADFIPDDKFVADEDKYGSTGQQVLTGLEGAAQGFLSKPLATAGEELLGVKPEDIAGREAANPWTHGFAEAGGLGAGLLTGTGEVGLVGKVGEAAAEAANLGKFGSTVLKGAVESGLFQGADEIGKAMLGQGDPEAPVSAALAHVGAATLLGGGISGVVGGAYNKFVSKVEDANLINKSSQFMEDFGSRVKFNQDNPNLAESVAKELTDFHSVITAASDEARGLKSEAIDKLVPEMNESIQKQTQEMSTTFQDKISEMVKDPESYPPRLTQKLTDLTNKWMEVATNPSATSSDIFHATDGLKRTLQDYSKFDKMVGPLSPEKDFIGVAKELSHTLRVGLEEPEVWGEAGNLQKDVNKAITDFLPSKKDFISKFTTKVEGEPTIDPGKINTYVNQLGKPNAILKQGQLKSYVDAADAYHNEISKLYAVHGLPNPTILPSLTAVRETLKEAPSAGAKFADMLTDHSKDLMGHGLQNVADIAGSVAGGVHGGPAGAALGLAMTHLGPKVAKSAAQHVTPAILRVLTGESTVGMPSAIRYAERVSAGAKMMKEATDALFTGTKIGAQKMYDKKTIEKNREKLRKFVEEGTQNQQIQDQLNKPQQSIPQVNPVQKFAKGGEVKAPLVHEDESELPKNVQPILEQDKGLETHFPEQSMLVASAKGRINNYLNSQRPIPPVGKLPFDDLATDKAKERSYDRALDIANNPLSIMKHIQDGTLDPELMQHFTGMYPEMHGQLSKQITERISKAQMDDQKPSYVVRQGLSLFMGAPLDSTLTPQSIQAAQAVFANKNAESQQATPAPKNKKGTSSLGKVSNSYLTGDQARQQRQNKV